MADLMLPPAEVLRAHVQDALSRYWPSGTPPVAQLPVAVAPAVEIEGPLSLTSVTLPDWAGACGVDGALLVPEEACVAGDNWAQVDWWLAAYLLLECWHERVWERNHGPIHSYSFRLRGWDERAWQRPWVNRIAMFLRTWAARTADGVESTAINSLPGPDFMMTHDVDAVRKTLAIRLKQGAFLLVNAGRAALRGDAVGMLRGVGRAMQFMLAQEDWWMLDEVLGMEARAGVRSVFHFYAEVGPKSLRKRLFDPSYDLAEPRLNRFIRESRQRGFIVGLHPGFESWSSDAAIREQRQILADNGGGEVTHCRQHWLRFGWDATWRAQASAGIRHDTTLMFNDRPGFRNSAAIAWRPWNPDNGRPHDLVVTPSVLMDSHLFDYQALSGSERISTIDGLLSEVRVVSGQAAVLWHPHTLTSDYGWRAEFRHLLDGVAKVAA